MMNRKQIEALTAAPTTWVIDKSDVVELPCIDSEPNGATESSEPKRYTAFFTLKGDENLARFFRELNMPAWTRRNFVKETITHKIEY